ncbi:MAG: hypothetical protein KatS3mg104_0606 [Phycisphaerae bacterium]|nr:MAG: hypothetical protein KatS3mg104_0606 [Phycisphaerae bacterium]
MVETRFLGYVPRSDSISPSFFPGSSATIRVYQQDANDLVFRMKEVDLAYIDPPYNQHPYGSNYFMLNLLVDYRRPRRISRVSGIPIDWRRSSYNKRRESEKALFDLLQACPAKFLLVSYNSEGFIDSDRMTQFLKSLGPCSTFQTSYTTFRGSRNLRSRSPKVTEYLFSGREKVKTSVSKPHCLG